MEGLLQVLLDGSQPDGDKPPIGSPPDQLKKYQSPNWFETQLTLSLVIGIISFLTFCIARTRSKVLFAPRTLLKGFSPHEVHDTKGFLSWILPTLKTSEFTVLQIVGLDAVVLLNFLKLGFYYFFSCALLAFVVLVPIHMREYGTTEGVPPDSPDNSTKHHNRTSTSLDAQGIDFGTGFNLHLTKGASLVLSFHLVFTYVFTFIALFMLRRTYLRFLAARQLFSLELATSVPARTVLLERLPPHLRSDRALADYWEKGCHLPVESVSVVRDVGELGALLQKRTNALFALENAWRKWLGNPVKSDAVRDYDPDREVRRIIYGAGAPAQGDRNDEAAGLRRLDFPSPRSPSSSRHPPPELPAADTVEDAELGAAQAAAAASQAEVDGDAGDADEEAHLVPPTTPLLSHPSRPRPLVRLSWNPFSKKVDSLEHLAQVFRQRDDAVRRRRRGKFRTTDCAFVTFETLAAAQVAAQVVHGPTPGQGVATLAPEPRDIHWTNMALTPLSESARNLLVLGLMLILLGFWSVPVFALARLLSYEAIEKTFPALAKAIGKSATLKALVQNSLPSLALIAFNALLPFLLEWLCILQGLKARTWIELSLMKKYHLLLLITVLFVFVAVSTISLLQDLRDNPGRIIDKIASSLPGARNFFISYVMLQGLAIMPLQLVQLAVVIPRLIFRVFWTRTPREFSELNAPPVLSLGTVYPQAILIFNVCVTYSVISPVILVFATLYFGIAYLVYKYKLLFVYYRPFESRGQAWPAACNRIGWGLIIFQIFMLGLFSLRQAFLLSTLVAPLIIFTIYYLRRLDRDHRGHARYVNLYQACAVEDGGAEADGDVERLRKGHPVTKSQTNLNTRRYEKRDTSLYIVGQDEHTDYAQPPMSDVFMGVLDTGRRRYAHPAIFGQMPEPQLPVIKRAPPIDPEVFHGGIVLDLRRRWTSAKILGRRLAANGFRRKQPILLDEDAERDHRSGLGDDEAAAARDTAAAEDREEGRARDPNTEYGVIALSDSEEEENEADATSGRTFFPHHGRRRSSFMIPGGLYDSESDAADE